MLESQVEINSKTYNVQTLKKLQENVSKLDKLQQFEIFKLIQKKENKLTENKNGIFINLSNLSKDCLESIVSFVNFSIENKKRLMKMEILSQDILKNSILSSQYDEYEPFLKNQKEKTKIESKIREDDKMISDESVDKDYTLEKEFILYNENDDYIDNSNEISNLIKEIKTPEDNEKCVEKDEVSKKVKYTGKKARLYKKCKESNKHINLNSIFSYHLYGDTTFESDEEQIGNLLNELTEDSIQK